MDGKTDISAMLELIARPAFTVLDGHVASVNQAAGNLLITAQTPISDWLPAIPEELQTLSDGCLFLTLHIHRMPIGASVTRQDNAYLFVLDEPDTQPQLQALSLAAKALRTPLSGAMLAAEKLSKTENAPSDFKKDAASLNQHLHQLLRVICNMSDARRYTQSSAGSLPLRNATALFREIFDKAGQLIKQTGIELRYQDPEEPIICPLDEEKLERAIYNLLSNAIKASSKPAILDVELRRKNNRLLLSIRDYGEGFRRELLSTAYSRYQRQPGVEDASFGIGLGMVLVRSAAAAHQGTVLIDHPAGGGTRVTLSLKIMPMQDATFRNDPVFFDYTGERDHGLVELSEHLPTHLYTNES